MGATVRISNATPPAASMKRSTSWLIGSRWLKQGASPDEEFTTAIFGLARSASAPARTIGRVWWPSAAADGSVEGRRVARHRVAVLFHFTPNVAVYRVVRVTPAVALAPPGFRLSEGLLLAVPYRCPGRYSVGPAPGCAERARKQTGEAAGVPTCRLPSSRPFPRPARALRRSAGNCCRTRAWGPRRPRPCRRLASSLYRAAHRSSLGDEQLVPVPRRRASSPGF